MTDTEKSQDISPIKINGQAGELIQKDGITSIIWTDPSTASTFLLQSPIELQELIKVAEGITLK